MFFLLIYSIILLFGISVVLYFLSYIIAVCVFDCDVSLTLCEKYGKKVGSLKGKIIWIVGVKNKSSEYLCRELTRNGARLILSDDNINELDRIKASCLKIEEIRSNNIIIHKINIENLSEHENYLHDTIKHFGGVDIFVNNLEDCDRFDEENIDENENEKLFNLNVFCPINLSRKVVKYFHSIGKGHVAVTTGLPSQITIPFARNCLGIKHANRGYYKSLQTEYCDKNIQITLLCQGPLISSEKVTESTPELYFGLSTLKNSQMSPERCGNLCAVALANELNEVWITKKFILAVNYVAVYSPSIYLLCTRLINSFLINNLEHNRNILKQQKKIT